MDLTPLKDFFASAAAVMTIFKNIKDMTPKGPQRDDIERALAEAERTLRISEASAASAMNYQICKCTWPPQIATSIGVIGWEEKFRCPACNKILPEDLPPLTMKPMTNY